MTHLEAAYATAQAHEAAARAALNAAADADRDAAYAALVDAEEATAGAFADLCDGEC